MPHVNVLASSCERCLSAVNPHTFGNAKTQGHQADRVHEADAACRHEQQPARNLRPFELRTFLTSQVIVYDVLQVINEFQLAAFIRAHKILQTSRASLQISIREYV